MSQSSAGTVLTQLLLIRILSVSAQRVMRPVPYMSRGEMSMEMATAILFGGLKSRIPKLNAAILRLRLPVKLLTENQFLVQVRSTQYSAIPSPLLTSPALQSAPVLLRSTLGSKLSAAGLRGQHRKN